MSEKFFSTVDTPLKKADPFRKAQELLGETLFIRGVTEDSSTTYDQPQFIFNATVCTNSQEVPIRFSLNDAGPQRRRLYEHFQANPDTVYGPCTLQLVDMANGRSFYKFVDLES